MDQGLVYSSVRDLAASVGQVRVKTNQDVRGAG